MWRIAKATIIRNHLSNLRGYPWTFTFGHMLNGSFLVLTSFFIFRYWVRGSVSESFTLYTGSGDYITFAVIGGLLSTMSISMMMNVSRALITEHREGTLEVILLAPAGRAGYLAGTAIQQLWRVLVEAIPVVVLGALVGARMPHAHLGYAVPALLLFLLACFAMGLAMGAVMLETRDTYLVQNTLFAFTALLCGFLFPNAYLPEPLRLLGYLFPLTDALQLLRGSLLTGIWPGEPVVAIVRCLVLTAGYGLAGYTFIGRAERRFFEKWH